MHLIIAIAAMIALKVCFSDTYLQSIAQFSQGACLSFTPHSPHHELYAAIVCGKSITSSRFLDAFKMSGLFHLLVVSGSHLIAIEYLIRKIVRTTRFKEASVLAAIGSFFFFAGAQMPVLRALIYICIAKFAETFRLNWSPVQIAVAASLLALGFATSRADHFSLQLSWASALALSIGNLHPNSRRWLTIIISHLLIWLILTPLLLPLRAPGPISIAANLVMAPWMGAVLFPASVLPFFFPATTPLIDQIWNLSLYVTEWFAHLNLAWTWKGLSKWSWMYLSLISLLALGLETRIRRPSLKTG